MTNPTYFVVFAQDKRAYWCAGGKGYTTNLFDAGAFTRSQLDGLNTEVGSDEIIELQEAVGRLADAPHDGRRAIDVFLEQGGAELRRAAAHGETSQGTVHEEGL